MPTNVPAELPINPPTGNAEHDARQAQKDAAHSALLAKEQAQRDLAAKAEAARIQGLSSRDAITTLARNSGNDQLHLEEGTQGVSPGKGQKSSQVTVDGTPGKDDKADITLEEARAQKQRALDQRAEKILGNAPEALLAPQAPTLAHRTSEDAALNILLNGFDAQTSLSGTVSPVYEHPILPGQDVREFNAGDLARRHHDSRFVVIMQFPKIMPEDIRSRLDQESMPKGAARYDGYLEDGVLPTQYIAGVLDQETGKYYTRDEFIALHQQQQGR